jgi:hypothetical protein
MTEEVKGAKRADKRGDKVVLGSFDVYLEGVGPEAKRDRNGRFFIYKKLKTDRCPPPRVVIDNLTILIYSYGDAIELGKY